MKISEEIIEKEKAVIAFRFSGSKCFETVQPSGRTSWQSFFDLRVKMLGEMLDEMFDRLTTIVWSHSNIKEKCWAKCWIV